MSDFEVLQKRLSQLRSKVNNLHYTNYDGGYKITYEENGETAVEVWK